MKFFPRCAPFFLLLLFAPCLALAQATSISISGSANSPTRTATYGTRLSLQFNPRSIVTGVPVSYEQVDDSSRQLADGTRITEKTVTSFFYRDSSGRTRRESQMFARFASDSQSSNLKLIEIRDPVVGVQYVLDTQNHIAYRLLFGARAPEDPSPASPSTASSPQTKSAAAAPNEPKPERTQESLGTQVMEGVSVEGHRTTTVYPVGSLGNDRPITRTCETWSSPDLGTPVLFKCSDLLNGDFVDRLTNISRAEPDPSLFQVPPNYQIVDGPADGHVTMKFDSPQK